MAISSGQYPWIGRTLTVVAALVIAIVLAMSGTESLEAQTPTPAPTPTPTPSVPATITLSSTIGSPNDSIIVTGSGFTPNTTVNIRYDGAVLSSSVSTGGSGTWSRGIIVPASINGSHTVEAGTATANFTVQPRVRASTNRGPLGTRVTITGDGFGLRQPNINVEMDGDVVASETANDVGSFTASFNIPRLPAGSYEINIANVQTVDFTVTSTFSISPETGPPGTSVAVLGSGFDSNASVSVRLDSQVIQQVSTLADGQLSTTVQIPQVSGGTKILSISGGSAGTAQATFDVTPTFAADRPNASPGTSVSVTGSGFGPNESGITIKFDGNPVVSGIIADPRGRWTGTFKVPTATSGSHVLRASGFLTAASSVNPISLTIGAGIDLNRSSGPPGTV
ncbi:MAG: IPT/TIG domain-containing protein, partial [Dehalococcoidia bacterium]